MRETIRYIAGYILGAGIFLLFIPLVFFELSRLDYLVNYQVLINSMIIRYIVTMIFFLIGAFFMIWSNIFLFMVGKGGPADGFGISVSPRTKRLVTNGPYRYSRNPMVFGAFSLYASVVIYLNTFFGLIGLLILLFIVANYLKLSEEKRLLRDFGEAYADYKKEVSMIFPIKRLKK
jgi:protein-S-isoprenylcysteine O-methyltransferase Ste14